MQTPEPKSGDYTVHVSGNTLNWPVVCACCGAPAKVSQTSEQKLEGGDAIQRTRVEEWSGPPYCEVCARHTKAINDAEALTEDGDQKFAIAAIVTCFAWLVALIIVGSTASVTAGLGFGIYVAAGTLYWGYQQKKSKSDEAQQIRQDAIDSMNDQCVGVGPAVIHQGMSGTIHNFLFKNGDYAEAFKEANAARVIF